jgi:hypothetical protein
MSAIKELIDLMKIAEFAPVGSAAHVMATNAAAELAAKDAAIEAAISALRAIVHDRPSAHTDQVWQQANATLARLEQVTK